MEPIIICPYVHDDDVVQVRRAFKLDEPAGQRLPFFFWHDAKQIGPELAYEHCWNEFPRRDIIIIHTDMSPMPEDHTNLWFDLLLAYVDELPCAGMIACDLIYPLRKPDGSLLTQCAGGYFDSGELCYFGGGVDVEKQVISDTAIVYDERFRKVRPVAWVTFGGVYIRRELLAACGNFDRRYQWAYVMDVDYSLEARLRGFDLFHVPVNLTHFESRTAKTMLTPERRKQVAQNHKAFYGKWDWWLKANTY